MKTTRKLDKLNRIVLPKEVADFGWRENTELDITLTPEGTVVLRTHGPCCRLCGHADRQLIPAGDGLICAFCLQAANCVVKS